MNIIGKTIENGYAVWTILSTPVFSHTAPRTSEKIYKVHAMCEPKDAKYPARGVDLHLDENDLETLANGSIGVVG